MLEPVGPLPPSVYWRRRAVAAIVLVLVLSSLVWAVSAAASTGGTEELAAPAPSSAPPTPVASQGAMAVPPGAGALGPVGVAPIGPVPSAPVPTTPPPGGATPPLLGAGSTDPQAAVPPAPVLPPAAPGPARVAPSPAPAAVQPCRDADLSVAARTDKPRYAADERPLFSLVVTNTGTAPCTRDLGPVRTAMAVVVKPGDGLWGSDDCAPGGDPDVRTLAPGQEQTFSVRWAGRTSAPGCPSGRAAVPAGTYQLLTRLDGTVSAPARFTIAS